MPVHLKKLCVGVDTPEQLLQVRKVHKNKKYGAHVIVYTRHKPKEAEALIKSGSLYRIMKNRIVARQKIIGFEHYKDDDNITRTKIILSPEMYRTVAVPHRPFQGWRYLKDTDVPADIGIVDENDELPPDPEMADALRESGLL